jgi:hypothetical protein
LDFLILFFIVSLNAALSGLVAYAAKSRNRSASAFFWLSFFVSFFVGILVLIALPSGVRQVDGLRIACPYCDEQVSRNAKICPHCRLNVGAHLQKLKAQEEKVLAERKKDLQAQAVAESRKAEAEALVRKKHTHKLVRNPITWITAGLIVIGMATVISLQALEQQRVALEQQRVEKLLLSSDCGVIQDSIDVSFDRLVTVKFSLPDECGENLELAIEKKVVDRRTAFGEINANVFFDDKLVSTFSVGQSFSASGYSRLIPNALFWTYPIDYEKIAETVRVELTYKSDLLVTPTAVLTKTIPKILPEVRIVDELRTIKSRGRYYTFAFLTYTTYQVADSIEFDWPGVNEDEVRLTPGQDGKSTSGWIDGIYTSETSAAANVVIRVIQNGKVVQTLKASKN